MPVTKTTSQEIKLLNSYGVPLKNKSVLIHHHHTDTLKTNRKGIIKINDKTNFDSITVIEHQTTISKKTILVNDKEFIIPSYKSGALPEFETKTINNAHILNSLKEFDHETISNKDILSSDFSTSADILLLTHGVTIQKSQGGGGSPIIRGFEANRILLMVDGVRMNNAIYRSGHIQNSLTIDPFIIEDCNVIYGPSAVSFGSDAIGGVVNYATIKPVVSNSKDSIYEKIRFISRFNHGADELTNHIDFNIGKQKWASFSSITFKQFGDITMGNNRTHGYQDWGKVYHYVDNQFGFDSLITNFNPNKQVGVGYDQIDLTQKILFKPNRQLEIMLNSQWSSSTEIQRFDQLNNYTSSETPQFAQWEYGPQKRWMNSISFNWNKSNLLFDELYGTASYQQVEESRYVRLFNSEIQENNIENIQISGFTINANKFFLDNLTLSYGGELYVNSLNSVGQQKNINTNLITPHFSRYPSGGSNMFMQGYYSMLRWQKEKYSLVSGIRSSINNVFGQFNDSLLTNSFDDINTTNQSLNGSIHFSYYPNEKTKYNVAISTGFRTPNIDDLGKVFIKDFFITVPNNNLIPEYAYNGTIGIIKSLKLSSWGNINIRLTGFGTLLDNMIIKEDYYLNGSPTINWNGENYVVIANQNEERGLVYGFNHALAISVKSFQLQYALNYTKGFITSNLNPIGHIPPLTGNIYLKYDKRKYSFSLFSFFNGTKKIADFGTGNVDNPLEATPEGYPSWYTLNAKFSLKINTQIKLAMSVNNLLDVHYKTFASGISAPGRNYCLTLRLIH